MSPIVAEACPVVLDTPGSPPPPRRRSAASRMSYRPPHLRGSQRGPARPATAPAPRCAPAAAATAGFAQRNGFTPSGASLAQRLSQRRAAAALCCAPPAAAVAGGGTGFGTCMRMCCEAEWREREQYRELSRLEYAPGSTERTPHRARTDFSRDHSPHATALQCIQTDLLLTRLSLALDR